MKFDYEAFKRIRMELRWTLSSIAEKVGVTRRTAYNWENGQTKPNDKTIFELAHLLGIPPHLITDVEPAVKTSNISLSSATKSWISLFHDRTSHQEEINQMSSTLEKLHNKLNDASLVITGLLSSINFPVYIKDTKQKYVMVNKAFLKNLSLQSNTKFTGKNDYYFFPKHEAEKNLKEDVEVLASEKSIANKECHIPGSRKKRWGLTSKIPIYDEEDNLTGLIGVFIDITERKKEEEKRLALEEVNRHLLRLFDIADEMVAFRDTRSNGDKWRVSYINGAIKRITGVEPKYFQNTYGLWVSEFVYHDDRVRYTNWLKSNQSESMIQYRVVNSKSKEIFWIEEKLYIDNNILYSVARNISQEKKNKDMLSTIMSSFDFIDDVITLIGPIPSYSFIFMSKGCEKMYGYPKERFLDENFFIDVCVHPDDRERMRGYRKKQKANVVQYRIVKPNCEIRWLESCSVIDRNVGDYFVVVDRDITDQKMEDKKKLNYEIAEPVKVLKNEGVDLKIIAKAFKVTEEEISDLLIC